MVGKPIRRFHLARVAVSPRSAVGEDRHERMEAVAERDAYPGDLREEAGSAPGRIRTCGPALRRRVLYPLSYGRFKAA